MNRNVTPQRDITMTPPEGRGAEAQQFFALAADLHRQGRAEDAIQGYSRVLSLDPNHADAYNNLGVALRSQGRSAAAVACYKRAIALNPVNSATLAGWSPRPPRTNAR